MKIGYNSCLKIFVLTWFFNENLKKKQGKVGKICFGYNTTYCGNSKAQSVRDFSLNMIVLLFYDQTALLRLNILENLGEIK